MRFRLPFVFVVHYVLRGRQYKYENTPWRIVLAHSVNDAYTKFTKKYPQYRPVHIIKV